MLPNKGGGGSEGLKKGGGRREVKLSGEWREGRKACEQAMEVTILLIQESSIILEIIIIYIIVPYKGFWFEPPLPWNFQFSFILSFKYFGF